MKDLFEKMFDEGFETDNIVCPYCQSDNTVLIDTKENTDPYREDDFTGTEHTSTKNYKCKNCSCLFHFLTKEIRYEGLEIDEGGVDDVEVSIRVPKQWYMDGNDALYDIYTDEDGKKYKKYNDNFYRLTTEFGDICRKEGCKYAHADEEFLEVSGPVMIVKKVIADGEVSDNDIHHTLFYAYQKYLDDELPSEIDYRNSLTPTVKW